jgi:DnaK suppressor protein
VVHDPETIKRFEETLRRQEKQLEQSMISAVEQGREVAADSALDAADQAVQSYQKEMLFSQGTSGHEQLALVRVALKRLNEGTYGECIHCGKTIGLKRLEALPWTPNCITCQEEIENGEIRGRLPATRRGSFV